MSIPPPERFVPLPEHLIQRLRGRVEAARSGGIFWHLSATDIELLTYAADALERQAEQASRRASELAALTEDVRRLQKVAETYLGPGLLR